MAIRFRGQFVQRVDDKARLAIPASYRQVLDVAGDRRLILVRSVAGNCIQAWPEADWLEYEDRILALPANNPMVMNLLRFQVASHVQVEPDNHGRVVLPPTLRAYAGIEPGGEVVIASMSRRFEIWAREPWDRDQERILAELPNWSAEIAKLGL
jgi:MraZ protein